MDLKVAIILALGFICGYAILFLILRNRVGRTFSLLANEALIRNNQNFMELARAAMERFQSESKGELALKEQAVQNLVAPLREALEKQEKQVVELERKRQQAYGGLRQYLEDVVETQRQLRQETSNLAKALQASHVRGKWGELSLRRVVELAGLVEHCDFVTQKSVGGADTRLRPDLIVYLPDGRRIVIDAKTPLDSYLKAIETPEESSRNEFMAEHSRQLDRHIAMLSSKTYWDQLEGSPEFVLLYIPLESLLSAALQQDPALLERSIQKRVVLATPTSLIALLRAVDFGWKQVKLAENAREISAMGKELYERITKLTDHFSRLGNNLDRAVQAYNDTAGSLERRVLVQARRFQDLGISGKEEIREVRWVDRTARPLQREETASPPTDRETRLPASLGH